MRNTGNEGMAAVVPFFYVHGAKRSVPQSLRNPFRCTPGQNKRGGSLHLCSFAFSCIVIYSPAISTALQGEPSAPDKFSGAALKK